jgi:hypothetical protein
MYPFGERRICHLKGESIVRRTHPRKSFFKPFMSLIGITTLVFLTSGFNTFNAHKLNGGAIAGSTGWTDL